MRVHASIHLLWLSALCNAIPTQLLARQGGPSQTAPDVVEYRDDYADNQGFSPADYNDMQGYTVGGIVNPGSPIERGESQGQSISFTYGVNIGIEKVLGVGGTYERTVEKSKGKSVALNAYCPEDASDAYYRCSANLTPVFYRKNGYSIRYVNDLVDGYVTWTADIPYTDNDGFQFYDFSSCLCENDDGGYPPLRSDFNPKYLPRCYDYCGPSPSSGTLPISHSTDGSSKPLRIMIVGDSITHGHDGDFTWRYRIWQWLRYNTNIAFDLVGPYRGTQPGDTAQEPQPPRLDSEPAPDDSGPLMSGGYMPGLDSAFDKDHFAVWGRQYAQDIGKIQQQVADYQPQLMLVALGFNDMGWFVSDAQGTLNSARLFVENARKANPNLHFAMANVPQRSKIGGRDDLIDKTTTYNNAFPDFVADLSTEDSPIHLVDFAGNYNCHPGGCPVGYDGLHPNAIGEYQIAQAFSKTLKNVYDLGDGPIVIPDNIPARNVAVPNNIRASPEDMGVVVLWDEVPGVSNYAVRYRVAGAGTWQQARAGGNRYDQTYTVAGIEWEFQVRSEYGEAEQGGAVGEWSGSVRATAERNTPPPPNDIVSSPTADGLEVTWGSVNGSFNIDRFQVVIWDRDTPGAFINTHAVRESPFRASGLNVGNRYDIFVSTWAGPGEGGLPASPPGVIVGGGQPGKPTNVQATNTDPTTVQITWNSVAGASAYRVYTNGDEAAGGQQDHDGTVVSDNHFGVAYLYPGTWHYTFCVAALNGDLESGTACVTPPKAPGFKV